MPKVSWDNTEQLEGTKSDYKRMYDLRERAQNAMKDLTKVLEIIAKVSKHPERDFAKIFQNEKLYSEMLTACHEAYRKSYQAKVRLVSEESWRFLKNAAWVAGVVPVPSEKDVYNADKRAALVNALRRKGKRDGEDYLKRVAHKSFMENYRKQYPELEKADIL